MDKLFAALLIVTLFSLIPFANGHNEVVTHPEVEAADLQRDVGFWEEKVKSALTKGAADRLFEACTTAGELLTRVSKFPELYCLAARTTKLLTEHSELAKPCAVLRDTKAETRFEKLKTKSDSTVQDFAAGWIEAMGTPSEPKYIHYLALKNLDAHRPQFALELFDLLKKRNQFPDREITQRFYLEALVGAGKMKEAEALVKTYSDDKKTGEKMSTRERGERDLKRISEARETALKGNGRTAYENQLQSIAEEKGPWEKNLEEINSHLNLFPKSENCLNQSPLEKERLAQVVKDKHQVVKGLFYYGNGPCVVVSKDEGSEIKCYGTNNKFPANFLKGEKVAGVMQLTNGICFHLENNQFKCHHTGDDPYPIPPEKNEKKVINLGGAHTGNKAESLIMFDDHSVAKLHYSGEPTITKYDRPIKDIVEAGGTYVLFQDGKLEKHESEQKLVPVKTEGPVRAVCFNPLIQLAYATDKGVYWKGQFFKTESPVTALRNTKDNDLVISLANGNSQVLTLEELKKTSPQAHSLPTDPKPIRFLTSDKGRFCWITEDGHLGCHEPSGSIKDRIELPNAPFDRSSRVRFAISSIAKMFGLFCRAN